MHLLGYIASLLIGISLGLIGGGGSILTMPVMVYLFGISPVTATAYSLFVVGSTSLVGAAQQHKQGTVNIRMALLFAATSAGIVFLTRKWLVPAIPEHIATIRGFEVTENWLTMVLFALLMLVSAVFMMRHRPVSPTQTATRGFSRGKMLLFGAGTGLVTGVLGAGGGFLLIPALVLILHLPMKEAVGTSLLVIALNSLIGFAGNLHDTGIDWQLLLIVTSLAIAGIVLGGYLTRKIPGGKLKKVFSWFVLAMGCYILVRELSNAL
ncbi:sulfite exporter TauE/SafE family protein [Chitinophaga lutea]|uniref:Probable membrane transporter protein n=1 Tax=Chitinophaga lutea TaxID=2488634 RepID=A0A3N4PMS1_9BACT|nr:sulfite exporter TauE/SafE family protein [Chitinophaga lutea]RPE09982.1 sulfite exporter TauE/SafE family protein [Chitinophaga lutea]